MASKGRGSLFYGLLLFIFLIKYKYMVAPKSFKCLGPLWVLIRPCLELSGEIEVRDVVPW